MAGCHDASAASDGVILTTFDRVMQTAGIKSGNPSDSKFYKSITDTDPGDRMPQGLPALSSTDIAIIRKWIEQGALNITCTDSTDSTGVTPSFATDVNPIIQANCVVNGCHIAGAQSPTFDDYAQISAQADKIKARTVAETMPPSGSSSLTNAEIDIIAAWVDGGHPNN
jgi:hypothetical protein